MNNTNSHKQHGFETQNTLSFFPLVPCLETG